LFTQILDLIFVYANINELKKGDNFMQTPTNNETISGIPEPRTMKDVLDLYGYTTGEDLIAKQEITDAVNRLRQIRTAISELGNIEKELKDKIAVYMKDRARLITSDGEILVTWSFTKPSSTFNSKLFKADNKELYEMYLDEKPGERRFSVK